MSSIVFSPDYRQPAECVSRQASEDIFEHSQPSKSSEPVIKFEFDQLAKVKGR
jgi:hypothetical protein